jgi:hypothetical protein
MSLKKTADQAHQQQLGYIGIKGAPNPWWGLGPTTNDCLGFQLFTLGLRTRTDYTSKHVSISAFRKAYGWHEIDLIEDGWDAVRFGDLICEEWPTGGGGFTGLPNHVERFVAKSGDHVTTTSANTGPTPGVASPRGAWQKTRTITDRRNWVVAIRPPYAGEDDTSPYGTKPPTAQRRKNVKLIAGFLNSRFKQPQTQSTKDGIPGRNYWTLVQKWGREQGVYGSTYKIDGIVGPRTRQVEAIILKRAKAAKK